MDNSSVPFRYERFGLVIEKQPVERLPRPMVGRGLSLQQPNRHHLHHEILAPCLGREKSPRVSPSEVPHIPRLRETIAAKEQATRKYGIAGYGRHLEDRKFLAAPFTQFTFRFGTTCQIFAERVQNSGAGIMILFSTSHDRA